MAHSAIFFNGAVVIGSLIFVLWFLAVVVCLAVVIISLLRKRRQRAIRTGKTLGLILLGYLLVLVGVSLSTSRRIIEPGETWRSDHWGVAVESAEVLSESETNTDNHLVAISLRVSNDAKGVPQRAADAKIFVADGSWQRFDVSKAGQEAYEAVHGPQASLDTKLPPESSFQTVRVFDVPKITKVLRLVVHHGVWPGRLIIGSEDSLFHEQTFIRLNVID